MKSAVWVNDTFLYSTTSLDVQNLEEEEAMGHFKGVLVYTIIDLRLKPHHLLVYNVKNIPL